MNPADRLPPFTYNIELLPEGVRWQFGPSHLAPGRFDLKSIIKGDSVNFAEHAALISAGQIEVRDGPPKPGELSAEEQAQAEFRRIFDAEVARGEKALLDKRQAEFDRKQAAEREKFNAQQTAAAAREAEYQKILGSISRSGE